MSTQHRLLAAPRARQRRRPAWLPVADRGSATVWIVLACLVTWSAATLGLSIGAVVVARHRAAAAADLAALAGARALDLGVGDPCAEAQLVAAATPARVVECARLADGSLEVVVEVALPRLLARWPDLPPARARARAGVEGIAAVPAMRGPPGARMDLSASFRRVRPAVDVNWQGGL